jgi:hypothetical protein
MLPHHRRHMSPSPLAQAALTAPPPEKFHLRLRHRRLRKHGNAAVS